MKVFATATSLPGKLESWSACPGLAAERHASAGLPLIPFALEMSMARPPTTRSRLIRTARMAGTRSLMTHAMVLCLALSYMPAHASGTSVVPPISRTVLERRPLPGSDQNMVLILVTLQPGVSAPLHHHPVAGLNYIVEGTAESAYGRDVPKLYRQGDTLQDLPDVPHTVFRNPERNKVLRFLVFTTLHTGQAYTVVP